MSAIHIGTQGWSYPDWIGSFYPPGAKQEHLLPFYASVFRSVEIDTTFYHPPKATIVRSWARHTPDGFRFSAKVPQAITHVARLARMAEAIEAFVRSLEPLGNRRGALLVQMPADFVRDAGTEGVLDRFLAACPSDARIAVEFRDLPRATEVTADFLYLRWMGHREDITRFDHTQIDRESAFASWEQEIRRALPLVL